jgi:hypothetical protein
MVGKRTSDEWRTTIANIIEREIPTFAADAELGLNTPAMQYCRKKRNSPASSSKLTIGFSALSLPQALMHVVDLSP